MKAYSEILEALLTCPEAFVIRGSLGSGPIARPVEGIDKEKSPFAKILLPEDDRLAVAWNVFLLLHDLSIDLQLEPEVRERLREEFSVHGAV